MIWQVQEAKQRLSELLRAVERDGPQVLSRHGKEIAVVVDVGEFRRLGGDGFKDYLRTDIQYGDVDFVIERDPTPAPMVELPPLETS